MGVDLDTWNPIPHVDGLGSHGGFCGPAVKPIALNMVGDCARDPQVTITDLGHRRHRDLARRGRVHADGLDQRAGLHRRDARRLPHRRRHDRGLNNYLDDRGLAR
jgi:dihydropyrimidine dehydrogenase (NAD+) subunit PreA